MTNRPIVLCSNSAWNLWNFRRGVIKTLRERGERVVILAPQDESVNALKSLGCEFLTLPMDRKGINPLQDGLLLLRMIAALARLHPKLLLTYTIKPVIYGGLAARWLRIPYASSITGLGTAFIRETALTRLVCALYALSQKTARAVIFQNTDDRDVFLNRCRIRPDQVVLVPGSGIDLNQFAPAPMPQNGDAPVFLAPVFLMVARLLADKGVREFVKAARIVKTTHPGARFQLLGSLDRDNRTAIPQDELAGWIDAGWVEYLGTTPDVRPVIAAADAVVLPSYREGTPRSLLEGAALARPLIATSVPGCREVVEDGQTGFLCEARDANDLAAKMLKFLDLSPAHRAEMGLKGREKMEREFDEKIVIERYLAVIDRV